MPSLVSLVLSLAPPSVALLPLGSGCRTVVDGRGKSIAVELPYRGSFIYSGIAMPDYLLVTRSPQSLLNLGSWSGTKPQTRSLLSRIFPQILSLPSYSLGQPETAEAMIARRPGAVFTWSFSAEEVERLGLPAIGQNVATESDALERVRMFADVLGQTDRSDEVIARYQREFVELDAELSPETISRKRTILMLFVAPDGRIGAPNGHAMVWRRAGLIPAASVPNASGLVDLEIVLRADPDIILISGPSLTTPLEQQTEWNVVRAVREHRVYRLPPGTADFCWNIIDLPFYAHWLAEIAYPERMKTSVRELMKRDYESQYAYAASETDLDHALAVSLNEGAAGYQRFRGTNRTSGTQMGRK